MGPQSVKVDLEMTLDMNLSYFQERVEDKGAWHAIVHGVAEHWTEFSD